MWGADITDWPTQEGWLDLAVVEDLFSRMVVGWSMAETMDSRLVVDALGYVSPMEFEQTHNQKLR